MGENYTLIGFIVGMIIGVILGLYLIRSTIRLPFIFNDRRCNKVDVYKK